MALQAFLLGRFELRRDGQVLDDWPRATPKRLFKLLAAAPRHALPVDQVMAALWPRDHGERVRQRLHHQVYLLRKTLAGPAATGDCSVDVHDGQVRLVADAETLWSDLAAFEAALGAALQDAQAPDSLRQALALYAGPLLPGDTDLPLLAERRHALAQRHADGLRTLAERCQGSADAAGAARALQQLVAVQPADEAAHRQLIVWHAQRGERAEAERQFEACRAALAAELGVPPSPATRQAYRAAMLEPGAPAGPMPGTLPRFRAPAPLVQLVGREAWLEEARALLADPHTRLLTLTGGGGMGKTQLALALAQQLDARYRDGVCFVSLAEVDSEGVPDRIRRALLLAEQAQRPTTDLIIDALRERQLLLVCDNGEHVQTALAWLSELLAHAPGLTVLVTSRRRLNLVAERVLPVPPLPPTPEGGVRLFLQRAQAVHPGGVHSAETLAEVALISRLVEGVPLSIELVAARSHLLAPRALREALEADLLMVAGGGPDRPARHRSLDQSLAWSQRLLSATEQAVLDRLTLFVAPFPLAAAAQVCADLAPDVSGPLQTLTELGLLAWAPSLPGQTTARLQLPPATLALVRQQRDVAGTASDGAQRFMDWMTERAAGLDQALGGAHAQAALADFDADHENFFAALAWAQRLDTQATLRRLVQCLVRYWSRSGAWRRADAWVLRATDSAQALPAVDAAALWLDAGRYWHDCQQFGRVRTLALAAQALLVALPQPRLQAQAALLLSSALYSLGEADEAISSLQQVRALAQADGQLDVLRVATNNLGSYQLSAGELGQAQASWQACEQSFDGAQTQARAAAVLNLSLLAHYRGQADEAARLSALAAELEHSAPPRPARLALMLTRRAWMHCCLAQAEPAALALQQAQAVAREARLAVWEAVCAAHEGKLALVRGQAVQASILLTQGLAACQPLGDQWDLLDLRLWLFSARFAAGMDLAMDSLRELLAPASRPWRNEHARILEAAAAWLARARQSEPARQAWAQAQALRQQQGIKRFPVEQARARQTQAWLRARPGTTAPGAAGQPPGEDPLAWLRAHLD